MKTRSREVLDAFDEALTELHREAASGESRWLGPLLYRRGIGLGYRHWPPQETGAESRISRQPDSFVSEPHPGGIL